MRLKHKLVTALRLDFRVYLLFPEVFFLLGFTHFVLLFSSFKRINGYLGKLHQETSNEPLEQEEMLLRISKAIELASKYAFWRPMCYTQALTAKVMLKRRNKDSTVYFGVKKGRNGKAKGHAWLRCGRVIVTGKYRYKYYEVLATYA